MISIISEIDIMNMAKDTVSEASIGTIAMVTATAVLGVTYAASKLMKDKDQVT